MRYLHHENYENQRYLVSVNKVLKAGGYLNSYILKGKSKLVVSVCLIFSINLMVILFINT